ncbi:MAG: hypothetical protein AB1Z98_37380, partial [Nannocystaceae bacterium]
SEGAFGQLLRLRGEDLPEVPDELCLTDQDLAMIRATSVGVEVPDDVVTLMSALRQWCLAEEIFVSDRRWRKALELLQVSAWTNGRDRVSIWDCWLLQHCLWNAPEQRQKVYEWYVARVGASSAMDPSRLTRVVVSWEQRLEADRASRTQMRDEKGRPLYGTKGTATTKTSTPGPLSNDAGERLYLAPSNASTDRRERVHDRTNEGKGFTIGQLNHLNIGDDWNPRNFQGWRNRDAYLADENNRLVGEVELPPLLEPTRHKREYIDACLDQLAAVLAQVSKYHAGLVTHIDSMAAEIQDHLWVDSNFAEPAKANLESTLAEVDGLLARITMLQQGFGMLPKDTSFADPAAPHSDEQARGEPSSELSAGKQRGPKRRARSGRARSE